MFGALLWGFLSLSAIPLAQAHQGGFGNQVMWQACSEKAIGDACSFENLDRDVYRGTCQSMASALACVRNQPIVYAAGSAHALEHEAAPAAQSSGGQSGRWWTWFVGSLVLLMGGLVIFWERRDNE